MKNDKMISIRISQNERDMIEIIKKEHKDFNVSVFFRKKIIELASSIPAEIPQNTSDNTGQLSP